MKIYDRQQYVLFSWTVEILTEFAISACHSGRWRDSSAFLHVLVISIISKVIIFLIDND